MRSTVRPARAALAASLTSKMWNVPSYLSHLTSKHQDACMHAMSIPKGSGRHAVPMSPPQSQGALSPRVERVRLMRVRIGQRAAGGAPEDRDRRMHGGDLYHSVQPVAGLLG